LGHVFSGLPSYLKEHVKKIGLPLSELQAIREFMKRSDTVAWCEAVLGQYPKEERLQALLERCLSEGALKTTRDKLYQALPYKLSHSILKQDLTTACVRLDLPDQTVFFDSGEERVVAQLLFKYGAIKDFIEGENVHVLVGESKVSLDFKIGDLFLEYHPLSRRDRDEGITLEEAGDRKRESVDDARFSGHEVIHIWKLEQLYEVLRDNPKIRAIMSSEYHDLSRVEFVRDLKKAKAYGHKLDRALKRGRERSPIAGKVA
jgi:hypothetical protein